MRHRAMERQPALAPAFLSDISVQGGLILASGNRILWFGHLPHEVFSVLLRCHSHGKYPTALGTVGLSGYDRNKRTGPSPHLLAIGQIIRPNRTPHLEESPACRWNVFALEMRSAQAPFQLRLKAHAKVVTAALPIPVEFSQINEVGIFAVGHGGHKPTKWLTLDGGDSVSNWRHLVFTCQGLLHFGPLL